MTATYNDAYGKNPYAKLKGEKQDQLIKVNFVEVKILKDDNCYWFAGMMKSTKGLVRSYKAELPIEPGLFAIPVYGSEYELRSKNKATGDYDATKHQPSIYEKHLHDFIAKSEDTWIGDDKYFKGDVNLLPNMMVEDEDETSIMTFIDANLTLLEADPVNNLPEFPIYSGGSFKKGGKSWGMKPDEKIAFLIKQMETDVKSQMYKGGQCLADLTDQLIKEHSDNPQFIEIYFQMLIACVR